MLQYLNYNDMNGDSQMFDPLVILTHLQHTKMK